MPLRPIGVFLQAAYWTDAIPKFLSHSRRQLDLDRTGQTTDARGLGPHQRSAVVATVAKAAHGANASSPQDATAASWTAWEDVDVAEEARESEAAIAEAQTRDDYSLTWADVYAPQQGPITDARGSDRNSSTQRAPVPPAPPPVDAAQFLLGRAFAEQTRNHTYDRFPLKYAPTCSCPGVNPCTCGLRNDVWDLSRMSTGEFLRFTTDAEMITVSWVLRPACAEKWFAGYGAL